MKTNKKKYYKAPWLDFFFNDVKGVNNKFEYVIDCLIEDSYDIRVRVVNMNKSEATDYMLNLISNYSMVIYYFQLLEEYEKCSEIHTHLTNIIDTYFLIDRKKIVSLISDSIELYEENGLTF